MFSLKESYGTEHHVYNYDVNRYNFKKYLQQVLSIDSLENVKEICKEYIENKEDIINNNYNFNDVETNLHKRFYNEIKKNDIFKNMYCNLIKDIFDNFFYSEDVLIYQS